MVQNKHVKALVRERMAKTGERYTAARRHLLATRATETANVGLLPHYPRIPVGFEAPASQYDAALWQRVFLQAGIINPATGKPFSAAMLTGLAGGIGFMVATFAYEELTTATVVLRAHPEPFTDNLLERSGVALERTNTTSANVASKTLDAALEAGRAAMVRVTHGALPWIASDRLELQESIDVVVVGRETDSYLLDGGGLDLGAGDDQQFHRASRDELSHARGKRKADRHWAVSVDPPALHPSIEALTANVRASIQETTARMLGTLPLTGVPSSWLPKFGVQGMRTFAKLLRDERTKRGWPALFADQHRLTTGLEMLQSLAASPRWGGDGGLRGIYAEFLTEAAQLEGLDALEGCIDGYRELAPRWDAFIDVIDPQTSVEDRAQLFRVMAEHLDELADREEQAARKLSDVVAALR